MENFKERVEAFGALFSKMLKESDERNAEVIITGTFCTIAANCVKNSISEKSTIENLRQAFKLIKKATKEGTIL